MDRDTLTKNLEDLAEHSEDPMVAAVANGFLLLKEELQDIRQALVDLGDP